MSSFDRRAFLAAVTALAGCGFEPVYAPGGAAAELRGRIEFIPPADEEGFALVNRLQDRLGTPDAVERTFDAGIRIDEEPAGFLRDGTITRYNVVGRVDWRLTRIADGVEVANGSEQSFTSYAATSTTVATIAAQRDARERLMVTLADRIVADILSGTASL